MGKKKGGRERETEVKGNTQHLQFPRDKKSEKKRKENRINEIKENKTTKLKLTIIRKKPKRERRLRVNYLTRHA